MNNFSNGVIAKFWDRSAYFRMVIKGLNMGEYIWYEFYPDIRDALVCVVIPYIFQVGKGGSG